MAKGIDLLIRSSPTALLLPPSQVLVAVVVVLAFWEEKCWAVCKENGENVAFLSFFEGDYIQD